MKNKMLGGQTGRTMIEAIAYISLMIMITVAAASVVNSGYFKYRLGRINQQLTDLKKVVSQRYVAAENYKDVKMQTLIDEKIAPHDVSNGRHAFGGDIKIGSGDENGTTFFIEFDDLPQVSCVELGMRVWIVNDGSDLDAMEINGKTWGWEYSNSINSHQYSLPAIVEDISKGCTKEWDNKIKWYFN